MIWYPAAKIGKRQQLNTSNAALFMIGGLVY